MAEESVRRRKKRGVFEVQSTLLMSNVYFLNPNKTKFILIGYSVLKDFKPVIVFCHDGCYVDFILSDCIALMEKHETINDWFLNKCNNQEVLETTKNIYIKKTLKSNKPFLEIRNIQHRRLNNYILLNSREYTTCHQMEIFIQNILKNYQTNWCVVEEYYNVYVQKCCIKNELVLDDCDYFYPEYTSFDFYKLFKEISIFCKDKLESDVTIR